MAATRIHAADRTDDMSYWPAMVDVLAAGLMVFIMTTYVQTAIRIDEVEGLETRQRRDAFMSALHNEFAAEIEKKELQAEQTLESIRLRFSDHVLFDSGKYELSEAGKRLLTRFSSFLLVQWTEGTHRAQVDGHTDSVAFGRWHGRGYPTNNWELSSARATQVVLFMHQLGVPAEWLAASGYADHRPIGDNATEEGRARNRRVEITLLFGEP